MAAAGEFKIVEFPRGAVEGEGETFIWIADSTTRDPKGGARSAPQGAWGTDKEQRAERTDYPGARLPSFQVLGSVHKPFTWSGMWQDRYNFPGYAEATRKRFDEMFDRGNPVRISLKTQVYWGIIKTRHFDYHYEGRIGYTFTFDPSSQEGQLKDGRTDKPIEQPERALDDIELTNAAVAKAQAERPAWAVKGTLVGDVSGALAQASVRINDIAKALDTRQGVLKPIGDAKRLAIQFRALQGDCAEVIAKLTGVRSDAGVVVGVRSDTSMGVRTGLSVLAFEAWTRNTRNLMRLTMGRSMRAAYSMDRRDIPKAKAVYRPFKGEHLYSISRKAYGTPNGWQNIVRANRLTSMVMQGTESLVIPEAGSY